MQTFLAIERVNWRLQRVSGGGVFGSTYAEIFTEMICSDKGGKRVTKLRRAWWAFSFGFFHFGFLRVACAVSLSFVRVCLVRCMCGGERERES